jgi:2-keto-4-pentenoate hydratase/2-oxohepta-3-ene-1,7-dioic acid hydratase in catechol pathway
MNWSLVTCRVGDETERAAARRDDGVIVELPEPLASCRGVMALMRTWDAVVPVLHGWDPGEARPMEDVELLAPLRFPNKVICAGANYRKHIAEMGVAEPGPEWSSWFFLKPPTTTVVAGHGPVMIDPDPEQRIDWEAELAVVIGVGGRNIAVGDAPAHVAGYTIVNDVSARGPHRRPARWARVSRPRG